MKSFLLAMFLVAFAGAVSGQADAKYLVKVKGIGLGSEYADVIKALGTPQSETVLDGDECRGIKTRTVVYDGLVLELSEPTTPETISSVHSIDITNAKWLTFGLKIGATQAAVKRKLGSTKSQETDGETGERIWYYLFDESDGPGNTLMIFKNGKLVKISSIYLC